MKTVWKSGLMTLLVMVLPVCANAALCEAPFMHENGYTELQGSGVLQLGASLSFTQVTKQSDQECHARVTGTATYGLAGLPEGSASLDYFMTVRDGQAHFERRDADGNRHPVDGKFDLRMLGLFAYDQPVTHAGQTFPEMSFRIHVDRHAVDTQPIGVHTGIKRAGEPRVISTTAGEQRCWPIQYTRTIDPVRATFRGIVVPVPGMVSAVTDWYCPELNMVMKQESQQNGLTSVVEVTELR